MFAVQGPLALLTLVSWLLLSGCAHYEPGDGSTTPFSSIQVSPVKNLSLAPQANQVLNHDLREIFIQSGKLALESTGADTELKVTLLDYQRETTATNSQDTGLARKYTLTFVAECDLINQTDKKPYFSKRRVSSTVDVFLDSGQTQAETNAIPLLSKKLAQAIANEVLQVW